MAGRKRGSVRARLRWIVGVLVSVVAAACILISWEEKHGSLGLPDLQFDAPAFLTDVLDNMGQSKAEQEAPVGSTLSGAKLEVHFLDVGQAESILIKGPAANVLIDAGENNQGQEVLRYLRSAGVRKLDYAVGTHPHADHIGGLDEVIAEMEIKTLILPEIPASIAPTTRTYQDVLSAAQEADVKVTKAKSGVEYDLGDGAVLRILGPNAEYADLNNMSVVARLQYGDTSMLFTGDAGVGAEKDMLSAGALLRSDVLAVGHHGSDTATSEEWLEAVAPRIAVISCGADNSYGHPHREVVERLELQDIRILRTDLNGAIVIASDGQRLSAVSEK